MTTRRSANSTRRSLPRNGCVFSCLLVGTVLVGACGAPSKNSSSVGKGPPEVIDAQPEQKEPEQVHDHTPFVEGKAAVLAIENCERMLVEGRYVEVLGYLTNHNLLGEPQIGRRQSVAVSVAWIRLPASMMEVRLASLLLYVGYLEFAVKDEPNNPRFIARLAEGYANYPKRKAEARALLEILEEGGRMPDAFAYATLAQLRFGFGDKSGARNALALCKKLDGREKLCSLTPQHLMPRGALAGETATRTDSAPSCP